MKRVAGQLLLIAPAGTRRRRLVVTMADVRHATAADASDPALTKLSILKSQYHTITTAMGIDPEGGERAPTVRDTPAVKKPTRTTAAAPSNTPPTPTTPPTKPASRRRTRRSRRG